MAYNHTQYGNWMLYVAAAMALYLWFIWVKTEFQLGVLITMILVIGVLLSFRSLNVAVDKKELRIRFGFGIFKKRYPLKDIVSAKAVRNHWYYGWGIRYWAPRRMWIYNVSGLDAVEFELKNGRVRRIGTDEPKKLASAIRKAIR